MGPLPRARRSPELHLGAEGGAIRALRGAALGAAAALAAAGALAREGTSCTLPRADRAHTASRECLSCHAGPGVRTAPSLGKPADSHPVGIDYAAAAARQPGRYAPPSELPADVPLPGGKIECTTCHDGASTSRGKVVRGMEVCLSCHRL